MDRNRGGERDRDRDRDRPYGGGSSNNRDADGRRPSRFSDGPPPSRFSDGPPPSRFSDGPPPSRFSDGPPPPRFSDGPPPSRFSDGPPPPRFSDGPPATRFSDGPPPPGRYSNNGSGDYGHRSPSNYRGGGRRAFVSPPHYGPGGGGLGQMGGDEVGGFRPVGGGGGFGPNYPGPTVPLPPPPMSGQKRSFSGRGGSPDRFDGGNFAKLFVGSVPRTATEGDIRPLFEAHGNVIEVALIKDKRTGQQQGCCFIKYATSEDADRAIKALHNQHTLPGGVGPIQVRYADGERERLGAVEHKLFVGSLNKQATVKEVEEIFLPYGQVDDVYLMRDEMKQSRGCGFVKYSHRDMALAAINALNGIYRMRGCDQPLTVRFADPKRPRSGAGDSRGPSGPAVGGPGFGPRFQGPGPRPGPDFGDPMGDHAPPNMWNPMASQNLQAAPVSGPHGFGSQLPPRPGDLQMPFNQGFNQPLPQVPSFNHQISPLSKPFQSPQQLPPVPLHQQVASSYSQTQPSHTGQSPYSQPLPLQPSLGLSGQLPTSQPQFQQAPPPSSAALQAPSNMNLQSNSGSSVANQQQLPASGPQQMLQQPLQQSPSQLAQMLSQQTQTLQATFQSSQQAFSQLQQQLQMMQPANPNAALQQSSQGAKQWPGVAPQQMVAATVTSLPPDIPPSSSHISTLPNQIVAPVKCNWTEHTSPGGFKYYYNSITNESKWEKPEELVLFEQQQQQQPPQQKAPILQPQNLPNPQVLPVQQATQPQQVQPQAQFQTPFQPHQLQQPSLSSGDPGYAHLPVVAGSVNDPTRFQGIQGGQEWMWKNKPAGT